MSTLLTDDENCFSKLVSQLKNIGGNSFDREKTYQLFKECLEKIGFQQNKDKDIFDRLQIAVGGDIAANMRIKQFRGRYKDEFGI